MQVTVQELIFGSGGMLAAIAAAWIHMRVSVAQLKTELTFLKKQMEEEKAGNKQIADKLDKVFALISSLKEDIAALKAR